MMLLKPVKRRALAAPASDTCRAISQLVLATFYFAAGTILTMELLTADTVTPGRQMLLAGSIGLMLLLACIHIAVRWRGLKLRKEGGPPASQPS